MSRSLKAHIVLVLISFVWGTTFVVVKAALQYSSPLLFNACRMTLAAICVTVLYRHQIRKLTKPSMLAGLVVGVCLFLGYQLQTVGLALTTPSKSAFLTGMYTVLVPLVLVVVWRARIYSWRVVGILAAFAGLFLMTVPGGKQGLGDFARVNLGDLLTIGCAVAFAFHIVFLGRATQRFPFQQMAMVQIVVAAVLMVISVPLLERPHFQPSATLYWAIPVTGICAIALSFIGQSWAQQFTPATHTALIFNLEPVFAWLTSYLCLHERLGWRAGAGALLILAGVLVSELLGNVSQPEPELAREQPAAAR
ncbi:MAG TPA: DMT family transporter [Verrucomicrobiae bacterium]|nr:DMT family transporter [Verrucomicrobiae bacterium]